MIILATDMAAFWTGVAAGLVYSVACFFAIWVLLGRWYRRGG